MARVRWVLCYRGCFDGINYDRMIIIIFSAVIPWCCCADIALVLVVFVVYSIGLAACRWRGRGEAAEAVEISQENNRNGG